MITFICDCSCACGSPVKGEGEMCVLCANGQHAEDLEDVEEDGFDPDAEVKFRRENPKED